MNHKKTKLIIAAMALGVTPCHAANILNFTTIFPEKTDIGPAYVSPDGILIITGRSMIGQNGTIDNKSDDPNYVPTNPNASAVVDIANLYWNLDKDAAKIYKKGLGIQPESGTGSKGISGHGGHDDEEIRFSYAGGGVPLFSISLTINELNGTDDDPIMWINTVAGDQYQIDEMSLFAAGTAAGASGDAADSWTINFVGPTAAAGGDPAVAVSSFTLRQRTNHIYVKGTAYGDLVDLPLPEPSVGILGALGGMLLLLRRSRKVSRAHRKMVPRRNPMPNLLPA